MVKPRNEKEIELMRQSGKISALAMKKVLSAMKPGVTCLELDKLVTDEILRLGGKLAFTTVDNYKWATCITINDEVVHGIPTKRILKIGDVVGIDLGCTYQGWFSDTAWSVVVKRLEAGGERLDKDKERFLAIGEEALWLGIKNAVAGNTIGDISEAIQTKVEGSGYSVVRSLVGHGVGKSLHEEPEVPGFGVSGRGMVLQAGMTLAVEVIYNEGSPDVVQEGDGWTISTADGSLGGLFEMTIVVREKKAEVLTDWRKV